MPVICEVCERDMQARTGCGEPMEFCNGKMMKRIKHGDESGQMKHMVEPRPEWGLGVPTHCHDCGAPIGTYHHAGCDTEECPNCHGQALGCQCYLVGIDPI